MKVSAHKLRDNFGRAADGYDARAQFQHRETLRVLDAARMVFPEQAAIADIGCGTGYFAFSARQSRPGWHIVGIDLAPGMCAVAAGRCQAINADAVQLPLADASLDAAVSSLCYQWVADEAAAFAELARVLKPGGRAVVASLGLATLQELRACAEKVALPLSLLPMRSFDTRRAAIEASGLSITFAEPRWVTEFYPNVPALLDSMRAIGAGNNFARAKQDAIGPKRFAAMRTEYERLRGPQGIPATWEHHFFILSKSR